MIRRATPEQSRFLFEADIAQVVGISPNALRRVISANPMIPQRASAGRMAYELAAVRQLLATQSKTLDFKVKLS
jgi:hypothetical protein